MKSVLGENHPDTIKVVSNLAGTYVSLEKYLDADVLYNQCLEKMKSVLGESHPDTIRALFLLQMYMITKPNTRKLRYYISSLEKMKSALGESHPDTLRIVMCLANTTDIKNCKVRMQ